LHAEIRTAREVISPNVCRVFDLVEADGRELLSMEFVDGISLRQLLEEGSPLDFFRAQEIAAQFLAGLEAIHAAGLVHRDFKPENVMLTRTGRVVVMDFGLARSLDGEPRSVSGTRPYMAPEQFLGRPVDRRSDVFAVSVVLAEMLEPGGVRDLQSRQCVWSSVRDDPPRLTDAPWTAVLRRGLARDPDERYDSAAAMARALEDVRRRTGLTEEKSPYPGLGSFTEADAANFFGREAEVAEIWKCLNGPPRLLGVIGPSGAGKSSLMRAGVMAARPEGWRGVIMKPGPRPFASLASALAPDVAGDVDAVGALARLDEPDVTTRLFAGWRKRCSGALLIIDQFEELFTLSPPETQSRFASIVGRLPIESDVHVVLSMRDDFHIRCGEHEALAPVFAQLVPLQPLTGDALRRALVQPALNNGYRFEDEQLVEEIVAQIGGERAALPLGAFAMARLWERRDRQKGMLTRAAYGEIGAVGGALAQHAEATLGQIGVEKIGVVREIFRNLVTSHGTRASRERSELESLFPEGDVGVIDALVNARLLTSYEEGRIEIVHESLLTAWPRLVQWQAQDADGVVMRDHLRQASELWEEYGRSEEMVWSGNAYREYEVWRTRYPGALSTREEDFARAMESRARRSGRRKQLAVAAVLVLAIAIAATFGVLWRRTGEAAREATLAAERATLASRRAEASKLVTLARAELGQYPAPSYSSAALAYAIASLRIHDTSEGRLAALEALWRGPTGFVLEGNRSDVAFSPDGRWLAYEDFERILLWERGKSRAVQVEMDGRRSFLLQFSPDGGHLLRVSADSDFGFDHPLRAEIFRISDANVVQTWSIERKQGIGNRLAIAAESARIRDSDVRLVSRKAGAFSITSRSLDPGGEPRSLGSIAAPGLDADAFPLVDARGERALYDDRGVLRLISLDGRRPASRELPYRLSVPASRRLHVKAALSADGSLFALAQENGVVQVGRLDGTALRTLAGAQDPIDVTFDRDGRMVAVSVKGFIQLWDLRAPPGTRPLQLRFNRGDIDSYKLTSFVDGWVGGASIPHQNVLWTVSPRLPHTLNHGGQVYGLAFSPDGKSLFSASSAGTVIRWPLGEDWSDPRIVFQRPGSPPLNNIAVSPDGRHLLVGGAVTSVWLVPLDGGEPKPLGNFPSRVWPVAFSPDGRKAATAFHQGRGIARVTLWDLDTGREVTLGEAKGVGNLWQIKFSPDGKNLVTAGQPSTWLWDLQTGAARSLGPGNFVDFSKDGRYLYAAGAPLQGGSGDVRVIEIDSGESRTIPTHGERAGGAWLDPGGTRLITIGFDGILRVGPIDGEEPHLLFGHDGVILGAAVSPDGKWIATGGNDGTVRLWPMPDVTRPPLHALPRNVLIRKLGEFTNFRAVPDPKKPSGYALEVEPFRGWGDLPSW
jgi:WD40 repeat protein